MSERKSRVIAAVLLAGTATAFAAPARAADDSGKSTDIIVTAQRRAERLQDVPMSITALPAEKLEASGVLSTADLAKVTPGLVMNFFGVSIQPAIRGISATGGNIGDNPSVATYVDGVYQAEQTSALLDLPDVQQIEVLKGPQGTLYGQNSTGGSIIITTREPSFDWTGKLSASYGNFNDRQFKGFVSGPLVADTVALSIAGGLQQRDGFRHHVVTGARDSGLDSQLIRGKLLIRPADNVKLTVTGYYTDRADSNPFALAVYNNNSLGYLLNPLAPKLTDPAHQFGGNPDVFIDDVVWGVNGKLEADLAIGKFSLISAYSHAKLRALEDLDQTPVNFFNYYYNHLYGSTVYNEFIFNSDRFGMFEVLLGGLYMKNTSGFAYGEAQQFVNFDANGIPTTPITTFPTVIAPTYQFPSYGSVHKSIYAVYAEATAHVTDRLVITAGGRYTHETQTAFSDKGYLPAQIASPYNPQKWSKFSPRVTARYELAPGSNVYASYSQGFKGGLINTAVLDQKVEPETIDSYEVGFKGRLADNFALNLSAFYYNYKNLQVVAYTGGIPSYYISNAAGARGKGLEADATWSPVPGLAISAGAAYLDAKWHNFFMPYAFAPTGFGNSLVAVNEDGKRVLRSPEISGNLSVSYEADTRSGKVGFNSTVYMTSGQWLDSSNTVWQKGYATLDAQISFAPAAAPGVKLVLWGNNLTDTNYLVNALVTAPATGVGYAAPRTFGIRGEFAF